MTKSVINNESMLTSVKKKMFTEQPFELQEAFNALRTNIKFASPDSKVQTIAVTSSAPNEGKSCITINLAKSLAKDGANVLLMDCDLRKPSLNKYLGIYGNFDKGLSSYLCGEAKLNDCILHDRTSNLYFLSAGIEAPNPAELLGSKAFAKLMKALTEKFDYVLCDTPPVDVVADALVLSSVCDGVVFVVRHKSSGRDKTRRSISRLKAVNANILGIVLNDYVRPKKSGAYESEYEYAKKKAKIETAKANDAASKQ